MVSLGYKKYLKKRKIKKVLIFVCQILILVMALWIWQVLADKKIINTFISSSPRNVFDTIVNLYKTNDLFHHIWVTTYETIVSFALGTIIGIIIATLLWCSKFLAKVMDPYLIVLNSLPKVSLGPILIIWIGANTKSIIVMALLISLIITIVNIYNGFISVDVNKINLMKSFKANKYQILKYLILPSNYKVIISSLKINISMSLIGA